MLVAIVAVAWRGGRWSSLAAMSTTVRWAMAGNEKAARTSAGRSLGGRRTPRRAPGLQIFLPAAREWRVASPGRPLAFAEGFGDE
jgi:hypothetical protein